MPGRQRRVELTGGVGIDANGENPHWSRSTPAFGTGLPWPSSTRPETRGMGVMWAISFRGSPPAAI